MLPSADIQMKEDQYGEWATRDDAEQAAKDAVEMAKVVLTHPCLMYSHREQANAIIERYEGGMG